MAELLDLTVAEAAAEIGGGRVSAAEYGEAWAEAAAGDELNAYLWRGEDAAPRRRRWAAGRNPGRRKGHLLHRGDRRRPPARGSSRATAALHGDRGREGSPRPGAGVLGKTNMDEFAMGSSNENSGFGPVLNPWDRERVPGGSSGGSAAAVAGGLAPCAIGTDTGGSIRQPASLCGIVGLKPTYGAVSRYGMIAFASSLDQCGPLTRDVTDAALLLAALEGRDKCDSTSVGIEGGVELPSREDLQGLRFGVPAELGDGRDRGRGARGVRGDLEDDRGARRRGRGGARFRTPSTGSPPTT